MPKRIIIIVPRVNSPHKEGLISFFTKAKEKKTKKEHSINNTTTEYIFLDLSFILLFIKIKTP